MTNREDIDRPMGSEQSHPPCSKSDGGQLKRSHAEAATRNQMRERSESRGEPARRKRAAAWRTGILRLLREASLLTVGREKP